MPRNFTYKMPFKGKWLEWDDHDLKKWRKGSTIKQEYAASLMDTYQAFEKNRFSFFLPHCDGADFINDRKNDIIILTKGNQFGGTCHGAVFSLMRIMYCDPSWMIFTDHGIDYHPFQGPKKWLIATNIWEIMSDAVWPEYQKLLPRYELGQYAPNYGDPDLYPEEAKLGLPAKELTFKDCRTKSIPLLYSKTTLVFSVYSQHQEVFESRQYDGGHLDEQMKEAQFDGFDERCRRAGKNFQCCKTLTGHKVKGRKDTGKGQWIHKKLFLGEDTKGHSVGIYKLWGDGVPDAILPAESKKKAYEKHVTNPKRTKNRRAQREGEARWFGGWEGSSGLVIANWEARIHLIPRIEIDSDWTKYRGIDHGVKQPTACLLGAMAPWGDLIFYGEYYETELVISKHCENIIGVCGNKRIKIDSYTDPSTDLAVPIYEEQVIRDDYFASVLDSRSFNTRSAERDCILGQMYNDYGLSCTPAKGDPSSVVVPKMEELFEIDDNRPHIMWYFWKKKIISDEAYQRWLKLKRGNYYGGAHCYVFNDLQYFQSEITSWGIDEETEKPIRGNDHLMACFRYIVSETPIYFGNKWNQEINDEKLAETGSRYTGYG